MAGITKGEWRVEGDVHDVRGHMLYCADVRDARNRVVCAIQSADFLETGITREEAAMNARAIAALPRVLGVLDDLYDAYRRRELLNPNTDAAINAILHEIRGE